MPAYIYLHGFASGPGSSKAQYFERRFREKGLPLEIPELDEQRFEDLTISSQLVVVDRTVGRREAVLIGSSLGGWLAALYASRHPEVTGVVLLAPAFGFPSLWEQMHGPEKMREWRETGHLPVFHFGTNRERLLTYEFIEDARRYAEYPDFTQPALILHGTADDTVPLENSIRFSKDHSNARLVPLASGHELTDVTERLWTETASFLRLG